MDAQRLHNDLCRAVDEARLPQVPTLQLYGMAAQLALVPGLAAAWARVLTEHTAAAMKTVPVYAEIELHAFDGDPDGRCKRWLPNLNASCGYDEDAVPHRVEVLPAEYHRALELWDGQVRYEPGEAVSSPVMATLLRLGLAVDAGGVAGQMRTTGRGRAWLEAHPRSEGGIS